MGYLAPLVDPALERREIVDVGVPVLPFFVRRENKSRSQELNETALDGDL